MIINGCVCTYKEQGLRQKVNYKHERAFSKLHLKHLLPPYFLVIEFYYRKQFKHRRNSTSVNTRSRTTNLTRCIDKPRIKHLDQSMSTHSLPTKISHNHLSFPNLVKPLTQCAQVGISPYSMNTIALFFPEPRTHKLFCENVRRKDQSVLHIEHGI